VGNGEEEKPIMKKEKPTLFHNECRCKLVKTSFGWAGLAVSEQGLCAVVLPKKDKKTAEKELNSAASPLAPAPSTKLRAGLSRGGKGSEKMLERTAKLLEQYFSGERVSFDVPLDMRYYTAFQQAVWKAAAEIPFGETRSYGWIAKRLKNPRAVRAVGQALGANPIPIIFP
jgi:methylated-DNA-[protein]-cysteine S-methyltransferase